MERGDGRGERGGRGGVDRGRGGGVDRRNWLGVGGKRGGGRRGLIGESVGEKLGEGWRELRTQTLLFFLKIKMPFALHNFNFLSHKKILNFFIIKL